MANLIGHMPQDKIKVELIEKYKEELGVEIANLIDWLKDDKIKDKVSKILNE